MDERPLAYDERRVLRAFPLDRGWARVGIDRSGCSKADSQVRRRLAQRGLLESHPDLRRGGRPNQAGGGATGAPPPA